MKNLRKLLLIFILTSYFFFHTSAVHAAGDLEITWDGVTDGSPIFTVTNMLPGDSEFKDITIENTGSVPHMIAIKGEKTHEEKDFADVLDAEITEGAIFHYGGPGNPKKLQDFFDDSAPEDDIFLFLLPPGETKTIRMTVTFPADAGNAYQNAEVVFNIIIGITRVDHLVINEVYYDVASAAGQDCTIDRNLNAEISGNGSGSTNIINFNVLNTCVTVQNNFSNVVNNVNVSSNTGANSLFRNLRSSSIITGSSSVFVNIFNKFNLNISRNSCCCGTSTAANDEWVEIYNPTDETVDLRNWTLSDNGSTDTIPVNADIAPGGFALISRSLSTWSYWDEDPAAVKIALNSDIGNGLENTGDHLILKNPSGEEIDYLAWEDDGFRSPTWQLSVNPEAQEGNSIERLFPGFDNDIPSDWLEKSPPTPGD